MLRELLIVTLALLLGSTTSCKASTQGESTSDRSDIEVDIKVPALPHKVEFAGEGMPIDRFDVRERLEEDLSVTLYMHSRTLRTLRGAHRYFPAIEAKLKEAGLPDDMKYITMAESSLNPNARSSVGAAGLWQLMPGTARDGGLEVNDNVDERYNVEKATTVAIKYLKTAYTKLGSWTLAAASYNVGIAGITRRQASQNGIKNYYDLFLPEETMRYVHRITAFKLVYEDPEFYGIFIDDDQYYQPFSYKEVDVSGANISWSKVAADNGTTYQMLRVLNPWIRTYKHANTAGKRYKVKVPID